MKEIRNNNSQLEFQQGSRLVSGYAIIWNSESNDLGGFVEVIEPTALDGVLEQSDVLALLNHNEDRGVLARSSFGKGSLMLEVDNIGLKYLFESPNTALGDELLEGLKRGDIRNSSFAFTVEKDSWEKKSDGTYLRRIQKIGQLFDVSPVYFPAYSKTSVQIDQRCLDKVKEMKDGELSKYYTELRSKL